MPTTNRDSKDKYKEIHHDERYYDNIKYTTDNPYVPRENERPGNPYVPSSTYNVNERPELTYPLNSGYKYPDDSLYYDDKYDTYDTEEQQPSVLENIRKNLPWPLSMVGRLGERDIEEDKRKYPDSIQSILSVMDNNKDDRVTYDSHQVLPFLDDRIP